MKKKLTAITCLAITLSGCADKSDDIGAAYVSPMQYQSHSCKQLHSEATAVSSRASQAMSAQNKSAENDAVAMGVGMVLFWPALFFIKGDKATAAEVARLKGEMIAIEQASNTKRCGIVFNKAPAPVVDTDNSQKSG